MSGEHLPFGFAIVMTAALFNACGDSARDTPGGDTSRPPTTNGVTVGAGGNGGAGGDVTINVCSCLVGFLSESAPYPCETCIEDQIQNGQPCDTVDIECSADNDCIAVRSCVGACRGEDDVEACVTACAYPIDLNSGTQKYHERLTCFCSHCSDACGAQGDLTCTPTGTGGMGGAGGTSMGGMGGN